MPKIFAALAMSFLIASCHSGTHPAAVKTRKYHLRFNPPDSSNYRYNTTSEAVIYVTQNDSIYGIHRTSRFTVNHLITKDSDEFVLETTFGALDYHEKNLGAGGPDVADIPGPARDLLDKMKTATLYAHVHPPSTELTIGGTQEMVNELMSDYYAEADRTEEAQYWGHWVEREFVWKNLDPLVWVMLDSAVNLGDQWADTTTNEDYINFKIDSRFQFDKLDATIATFRSEGHIANDPRGTYLLGKSITGVLTGTEDGKCLIDTTTGLPIEMEDAINAQGDMQIDGHKARIKIVETIKMVGMNPK